MLLLIIWDVVKINNNVIEIYEDVMSGRKCRFPDGIWDSIDNIKTIIRYVFFQKLNKTNYDELYKLRNDDFAPHKLSTILNYFNYNMYKIVSTCFPEYKFFIWKFNRVPTGYWEERENRVNAFRELVEEELKIDILDIPQVITPSFLKKSYPKLLNVYNRYYKDDLLKWVHEVYPNTFKKEDFYSLVANDGTILKSREELKVHNLLLQLGFKVKYFDNENKNENKMYNKKYNENYVPDWLLNENIIVEYFGLYAPHRNTNFSIKYVKRTHRKIEFYQKYCKENPQYFFIALFPEDIEGDMVGAKAKLLKLLNNT